MFSGRLRQASQALVSLCLLLGAAVVPAGPDHAEPASLPIPGNVPVVSFSHTIQGLEQAWQRHDGAIVVRQRLSGTGHVDADHIVIEGMLAPGHSPGCISFGGDVTFGITSTLVTEIGGTSPCTEHDRTSIANTLTINSATLEIVLINGFTPQFGERFDILDWGTLSGSFGIIDTSAAALPAPLVWDSTELYLSGELIVDVTRFADGDLAPWGNPDGQINAADVLIATRLALGLVTAGPLQIAHGDMNADNIIDLADLLVIQQAAL